MDIYWVCSIILFLINLKEKILKKHDEINHKIEAILKDDDILKGFTFFFNKAENVRVASLEIQQVLENFISNENEREILEYEDKIAFIDGFKIKTIYDAIINKSALKLPLTLQEFKQKYQKNLLKTDEWGEEYRKFIAMYNDGDKIYEKIASRGNWKRLCGSAYVVMQRNDETIAVILKSMN